MVALAPAFANAADSGTSGTTVPELTAKVSKKNKVTLHWKFDSDAKQRDRVVEVEVFEHDGVDEKWEPELTRARVGKTGSYSDKDVLVHERDYRVRVNVGAPNARMVNGAWSAVVSVTPTEDAPPPTTPPTTPPTNPPSGNGFTPPGPGQRLCGETLEADVLRMMNAERAKKSLPALAYNEPLAKAARHWSVRQATEHNMNHGNWAANILAWGYPSNRWMAENIYAGPTTAAAAMSGWMASTGHRNNILHASMRNAGVSCVVSTRGVYYWTVDFGG